MRLRRKQVQWTRLKDPICGTNIFTNVQNNKIAQEEVFGPVLSIIRFKDEKQYNSMYTVGLAAGVWTSNIGRLLGWLISLKLELFGLIPNLKLCLLLLVIKDRLGVVKVVKSA